MANGPLPAPPQPVVNVRHRPQQQRLCRRQFSRRLLLATPLPPTSPTSRRCSNTIRASTSPHPPRAPLRHHRLLSQVEVPSRVRRLNHGSAASTCGPRADVTHPLLLPHAICQPEPPLWTGLKRAHSYIPYYPVGDRSGPGADGVGGLAGWRVV